MQSLSLFELIKQVLVSWQVIVITVGIVLYLHLVFYLARRYHRPISFNKISFGKKDKPKKEKKAQGQPEGPEEAKSGKNSNDELGLEEQE